MPSKCDANKLGKTLEKKLEQVYQAAAMNELKVQAQAAGIKEVKKLMRQMLPELKEKMKPLLKEELDKNMSKAVKKAVEKAVIIIDNYA